MSGTTLCTYCNSFSTTRDHIPPKLLFPSPRPSNLATVPACQACNQSFAVDDEYARMVLISHYRADHSAVAEHLESLTRALGRPRAAGLRNAFLVPFAAAGAFAPGPEQGRDIEVNFDLARVGRVVARTAIGLHRIHYKERLVPEYGAFAAELDGIAAMPDSFAPLRNYLIQSINEVTETCRPLDWANSAVVFAFGRSTDDARQSVWRLRFFGGAEFGAWTAPRDIAAEVEGAVYAKQSLTS